MKPRLARVIKRLPESKYNVTEAAKLEGYSKSYAETLIHKTIKKYIGVKDDDTIKDEFLIGLDKDIRRFRKEKDNTNYVRVKEMKSRVLGIITDKSEVTQIDKQDNQFSLERLTRIKQAQRQ